MRNMYAWLKDGTKHMIRYDLTCANDHQFDSWFRSGADCDALLAKKLVSCTACGDTAVRKALMTPGVSTSDKTAIDAPLRGKDDDHPLAKLKREIEEKADDVGQNFATQARDMHDGLIPNRPIYGQANGAETKALLEDGVPILPLPFVPTKKTN